MLDNGLLKYYNQSSCENGVLDYDNLPVTDVNTLRVRLSSFHLPEGTYFSKLAGYDKWGKRSTDAEVLLSQIYSKMGLNSAIYFPAQYNFESLVLSDSVQTDGRIKASEYFNAVNMEDSEEFSSSQNPQISLIQNLVQPHKSLSVDFLKTKRRGKVALNYFTNRAMAQQITMRVLDTASLVTDRHKDNFFYSLDESGKIDDVSCIDYEQSGIAFEKNAREYEFFNDFLDIGLTKSEILYQYRSNETIPSILDTKKLAEEIGSINPKQVAEDIKQTIGYEVDEDYTSFLDKSFNEMAEALIQ